MLELISDLVVDSPEFAHVDARTHQFCPGGVSKSCWREGLKRVAA